MKAISRIVAILILTGAWTLSVQAPAADHQPGFAVAEGLLRRGHGR